MAQWKRAGPITQRSVDRNYALLIFSLLVFPNSCCFCHTIVVASLWIGHKVPLAQRIARWTSNPKVLGSIPRWDDYPSFCFYTEITSPFPCVRMAEWSKAPDSRASTLLPPDGGAYGNSGPHMRAGVRIPFLTNDPFSLATTLFWIFFSSFFP